MRSDMVRGHHMAAIFILFNIVHICCSNGNTHAQLFVDYMARGKQALEFFPEQFLMHDLILQSDIALTTAIYRLINLSKNTIITRTELANACFYLEQSKRFKHIRIALKANAHNSFDVHLDLTARWLVNRVELTNIYWRKTYIQNLYLIQPGEPFDEAKHQESLENIRKFYQEQGYANARVSAQQKKINSYKGINISITVETGPRHNIKKTSCELHAPRTPDTTDLKNKLEHLLAKNLTNKFYSERRLQQAQLILRQALVAANHPCAQIHVQATPMRPHAYHVQACVNFDKKNNVIMTGHDSFSREQLNRALINILNQEIPTTPPLLAHYIANFYQTQNFTDVTVDLVPTDQGWQIKIHEGTPANVTKNQSYTLSHNAKPTLPPPIMGNTIIVAPPAFDTNLILSELTYQQGKRWNQDALEKTISNLQELGALSAFSVHPLQTLDLQGQHPIVLTVTPDNPFEMSVRAGGCLGNQSLGNSYTVGASLLYKYIGLHVHRFWLDTQLSRFCGNIGMHYQYPHVYSKQLWLQTDVTYQSCEQCCIGPATPRLYRAHAFNVQGHVMYRGSRIQGSCMSGLQALAIKNCCALVARALAFEPCDNGRYHTYLFMQPRLQLSLVDNQGEPTCGSISAFEADAHIDTHARYSFAKIMAEQSFFVPCGSRMTLALRARAGHIWSRWARTLPSERFYLGGPCTIRSYQQNYAPPYGHFTQNGITYMIAQGGNSLVNFNTELRVHVHTRATVVPFFDTGALKSPVTQKWYWAQALGAGVRYATPLGPIRFDIGWKLTQSPRNFSSYAWYLSFGNTF